MQSSAMTPSEHASSLLSSGDPLPGCRPPPVSCQQTGELDSDVRLVFRMLLAVDIERYSARSAREQLQAQVDLRWALDRAAKTAGLDQDLWHQQVSGDGELAVLPETADVPQIVGKFSGGLESALAELNTQNRPSPCPRVRLAMHYGTLILGPRASFGPAGDAPIVVSRLLDARPLRQFLIRRQDHYVALIVSERLLRM